MSGIQRAMNWLRSIKDAHKFDEDKIQRDDKGRFTSTGGGNTGGDGEDKVKDLERARQEVQDSARAIAEHKEKVQQFYRNNPEPPSTMTHTHKQWMDKRQKVYEGLHRMERWNREATQKVKGLVIDRAKKK